MIFLGVIGSTLTLHVLQLERQQRQDERNRYKSTLVIQSFYRGRRDVCMAKEKFRSDWDLLIGTISSHSHTLSFNDIPHVMVLLRQFVYFFDTAKDISRYKIMSRILLEKLNGISVHLWYINAQGLLFLLCID